MNRNRPTKLKKMNLNSVDFVRRGANPDAHIMLKKSYDGEDDDIEKQPFFKTLVAAIKKAFSGEDHEIDYGYTDNDIQKSADDMQHFTDCLAESYDSIMGDTTLTKSEKIDMIAKSTNEFTDTMEEYLSSVSSHVGKSTHDAIDYPLTQNNSKGGYETMGINLENVDKSLLTSDEAAQLDALIAKACKTKKADENMDDTETVQASCKPSCKKKTDETMPQEGDYSKSMGKDESEVEKALKEELAAVQELRKSMEMKEYMDIAKKYESIGKKPEDLAKTLYDMKQAGDDVYKSYVDALDEQVSIIEKSGLFVELGKSGGNGPSYVSVGKSEAEGKIEALAAEIRKSDASIGYHESIAKAWEQNPDLVAAYDDQYMA